MPATDPDLPWKKISGLAVLLIVGALGSLELFWRSRGHFASISSDVEHWCYHRDRLEGAGRETLALLGASRMQLGFMQETFVEHYPGTQVVQLSTPGKSPYALLRDVAEDESFTGVVLCSLQAFTLQPAQLERTQRYVDHHRHKWGPGAKVSLLLSCAAQSQLVFLRPNLCGKQLINSLLRGELPRIYYVKTLFNRRRIADYSLVDVPRLIDTRIRYTRKQLEEHPPASAEEWARVIARVSAFARRIEARGGAVVFIRYPMQGRFLELDRELLPDEKYWDVFRRDVGFDCLDYTDMPGYEELRCEDQSHLDHDSAIKFTLWIGRQLEARGLVQR